MERISGTVFAAGIAERARGGDGYDVMEAAQRDGWTPVASWGRDGWDLGEWPYLIYFVRPVGGGRVELVTYCEGDVAAIGGTAEEVIAHVDWAAFSRWRYNDEEWVEGCACVSAGHVFAGEEWQHRLGGRSRFDAASCPSRCGMGRNGWEEEVCGGVEDGRRVGRARQVGRGAPPAGQAGARDVVQRR